MCYQNLKFYNFNTVTENNILYIWNQVFLSGIQMLQQSDQSDSKHFHDILPDFLKTTHEQESQINPVKIKVFF